MSANMAPSSYGSMADVATFGNQWPRPTSGPVPSSGPATSQVAGVPRPVAMGATGGGNPAIPWAGFVVALVILRVLSHISKVKS